MEMGGLEAMSLASSPMRSTRTMFATLPITVKSPESAKDLDVDTWAGGWAFGCIAYAYTHVCI